MMEPRYFSDTLHPHHNSDVAEFVCDEIWGTPDAIEKYCTMGVYSDKGLVAGTVYHNYHPKEGVVELTSASLDKRWLTKRVIRAMFWLPFMRLGCQLIVLRVSERNLTMCKIAKTFGFDETYIPRLRGRDEGEFIFTYTDDMWKSSKYYGDIA